jgi:hypothetical protein
MKNKNKDQASDSFVGRQSNVLPHHVVPNSGLFQGLLLKGAAATSPLQRIGKLLIGFFFIGLGSFFLSGIVSDFLRHSSCTQFLLARWFGG